MHKKYFLFVFYNHLFVYIYFYSLEIPLKNIDTLVQIYIDVDDFFLEFGSKIK